MAVHIILASHGLFAQEALQASKMIIGEPRLSTSVVSVTEGRSMESCFEELQTLVDRIPETDEVLILVDIYGGTPSNIATMLILSEAQEGRIQAYAGLNLPMLIELLATNPQTLADAQRLVVTSYPQALVHINEKTKGMKDDGNQTL